MDTSKEYIKMCEKAEEIQKEERVPLTGDIVVFCNMPRIVVYMERQIYLWYYGTYFKYSICEPCVVNELTWLPRQDQLQELYVDSYATDTIIFQFHKWWVENRDIVIKLNSMEQLWLAFVMKEKYSKQWVKGEWEKTP